MKIDEAEAWTDCASHYTQNGAYICRPFSLDMLPLASLRDASDCLDVACGPGLLSAELARRGHRVCASDFSHGMTELAAGELRRQGTPFETKVADGHTLEGIGDGSYDAVFSNFGLYLIADRMKGWKSALRVLRPGGKLIASGWDKNVRQRNVVCAVLSMSLPQLDNCSSAPTLNQPHRSS